MLVIADEVAVRVGRKRRFSGAREAKEKRCIAVFANVCSAVHGHDIATWQEIILH